MTSPDFSSFALATKGNQYEDFTEGQIFLHHWGRTITESDNIAFTTSMANWNPMHLNAEYARAHGHPDVVVNPLLVLCVVVGLSVEDLSEGGGLFLGINDCRFHGPVHPGETISASSTVIAKRLSASRPDNGVVTWRSEARNQRDEPVVTYERSNFVRRRGA